MTKTIALIALLGSTAAVAQTSTTTTKSTTTSTAPATTAPATAAPAATADAATPTVGGAPMYPTKTIVENASASKDHTTLVAAVKAAGLVETLSGPGPFTVFAPTNEAFTRLAPGTVDTLLKPENKPSLTKVLTYHVVAGKLSAADLTAKIQAGGGKATLTTVEGQTLTAVAENNTIKLTDVSGNSSFVQQADVNQSNGVVHVVNGVLVPKLG